MEKTTRCLSSAGADAEVLPNAGLKHLSWHAGHQAKAQIKSVTDCALVYWARGSQ